MKYKVTVNYKGSAVVEVDADNEDHAEALGVEAADEVFQLEVAEVKIRKVSEEE